MSKQRLQIKVRLITRPHAGKMDLGSDSTDLDLEFNGIIDLNRTIVEKSSGIYWIYLLGQSL